MYFVCDGASMIDSAIRRNWHMVLHFYHSAQMLESWLNKVYKLEEVYKTFGSRSLESLDDKFCD